MNRNDGGHVRALSPCVQKPRMDTDETLIDADESDQTCSQIGQRDFQIVCGNDASRSHPRESVFIRVHPRSLPLFESRP